MTEEEKDEYFKMKKIETNMENCMAKELITYFS